MKSKMMHTIIMTRTIKSYNDKDHLNDNTNDDNNHLINGNDHDKVNDQDDNNLKNWDKDDNKRMITLT